MLCMHYDNGRWDCRTKMVYSGDNYSQTFYKGSDGSTYVDARPRNSYRSMPVPR
jgi:hypothetical protein